MSQAVTNLPSHFIDLFNENWGMQAQQMLSRMKAYVTLESSHNGGRKRFDDFDQDDAVEEITVRAGTTVRSDLTSSSRWLSVKPYASTKVIDEWDDVQLAALGRPDSSVLALIQANMERLVDKRIFAALEGPAITGDDGTGPAATFPAAQTVARDYVRSGTAANSGLTLDKLRRVKSIFGINEVVGSGIAQNRDTKIIMAVSQTDLDSLLTETEVTSADYNNVQPLVSGQVDEFLGIKFIRSEQLTTSGSVRNLLAWVPSAVHFFFGDQRTHIDPLPENSHARQIRAVARMGGVRRYDKKVVMVKVNE
jgi:hypothetical protein